MGVLYVTAFRAMGCEVNVWLETDHDGRAILEQVPAWIEELESVLSRFRPESELSHLNMHIGEWVTVSDVLLANIVVAKHGARLTGGLYNPLVLDALAAAGYDRSFEQIDEESGGNIMIVDVPDWHDIDINMSDKMVRLPGRIDLGGVAKGWTAEQIANRLSGYGPCLVDLGGDIAACGQPAGKPGWEIAVSEPGEEAGIITSISLANASVVTSGTDYRRWRQGEQLRHHLIDPRTGQPAQTDVITVTVVHRDAPTAEAYAKAVVMLGSVAGLDWIGRQWEGAALVVRDDGTVLATERFQTYLNEGVTL